MEFGRHLSKGLWGFAGKTLPVIYGLGYVLLVIRVLPEEEFGIWVLIQEIFLLISGLATAFALNPLLKFVAEESHDHRGTVTAAVILHAAFIVVSSLLVIMVRSMLGSVLHSPALGMLLLYLPAMFAASFVRNIALILLQARFKVKELFATDAVHFLGAPLLIWIWSRLHMFNAAMDLVTINIISLSCSSVVGLLFARRWMALTRHPGYSSMKKVWDYGTYSLGGVLSSLFSGRADSFILAGFTGPVQVAVYNSVKIFIRVYETITQAMQMFVLPATARFVSRGDRASLKVMTEKSLLFGTVAMIPVFLGFWLLAPLLVHVVYQGRYLEAVPQLQIFAILAFAIPSIAVATSIFLGLGEVRVGFVLSLQGLAAAIVCYFLLIPVLGVTGATLGYVLSSGAVCVLAIRQLRRFVPMTFWEVWLRWRDVMAFGQRIVQHMRGSRLWGQTFRKKETP